MWGQPVAKKIAVAAGVEDYNLLQNNGRLAHQEVDHVSDGYFALALLLGG